MIIANLQQRFHHSVHSVDYGENVWRHFRHLAHNQTQNQFNPLFVLCPSFCLCEKRDKMKSFIQPFAL